MATVDLLLITDPLMRCRVQQRRSMRKYRAAMWGCVSQHTKPVIWSTDTNDSSTICTGVNRVGKIFMQSLH